MLMKLALELDRLGGLRLFSQIHWQSIPVIVDLEPAMGFEPATY